MKRGIDIRSLVLGAVLEVGIVLGVAAATSGGSAAGWEYTVVSGDVFQNDFEKALNGAVAGGWEFVSASQMAEHHAFAVLKREKK